MDFKQAQDWLYSQLPMFTRIGKAALKPGLDNTIKLLEAFDNPQHKFKSIHVAGTNGKGSTSHTLAAIFQKAGYKTGLYTSPHLKHLNERIRINGVPISEQAIALFTERVIESAKSIQPSFFEVMVAMAFNYFAEEQVDIAIIEVGLGGRLDSTNVIIPELSVITTIGWDHMDLLGDTLPKIAAEKAGIIKESIPVVISHRQDEEVMEVFASKALEMNAPAYVGSDLFEVSYPKFDSETGKTYWQVNGRVILFGLNGWYQQYNLSGILMAIEVMKNKGYHLPQEAVLAGLSEVSALTGLKGRWQIVQEKPLSIADTGHNLDGLKETLRQIESLREQFGGEKLFVLGFVSDKDIENIVELFPKEARYFLCAAKIPRALPVVETIEKFRLMGFENIKGYDSVDDAWREAQKAAGSNDVIYIGGSTFVVAEIPEL